jgi:hypothetical protein
VDEQGSGRWYTSTKVPLRDGNGEIVGLAGVKRDITERKWAEEALRKLCCLSWGSSGRAAPRTGVRGRPLGRPGSTPTCALLRLWAAEKRPSRQPVNRGSSSVVSHTLNIYRTDIRREVSV